MPYDPKTDTRTSFDHWLFDNPNSQDAKDYQQSQQAQGGDKKHAPPPADYTGAAEKQAGTDQANVAGQTAANRPNQTNAFGSTVGWTIGPDGRPVQSQSFGGPFAGLASSLQGQAASAMGSPVDFGSLGQLGTGDQARDQAINAAYGQATSRLDPQWQQREAQQRSQLLNQGLDPNSEAYTTAMGNLGRERNDAYSSAMNGAIGQGTAAGHTAFEDNLGQRQQMLSELLQGRGQALGDLGKLGGFLGQQGFNTADRAGATNYLGASGMQDTATFRNYNQNNQNQAQFMNQLLALPADVLSLIFGKGGG